MLDQQTIVAQRSKHAIPCHTFRGEKSKMGDDNVKKTNETVEKTSLGTFVGQWIERPPGVREVMGSIPIEDLEFFFVPRSCSVHLSHFITELKIHHFYSLINYNCVAI